MDRCYLLFSYEVFAKKIKMKLKINLPPNSTDRKFDANQKSKKLLFFWTKH